MINPLITLMTNTEDPGGFSKVPTPLSVQAVLVIRQMPDSHHSPSVCVCLGLLCTHTDLFRTKAGLKVVRPYY